MSDGVLVTGARAPVAVHWAWALQSLGRRVHLGDSARWPLGQGMAGGDLRFAAPARDFDRFREDVLAYCAGHGIGMILPTCEEVFWLAAMGPDLMAQGVQLFAPLPDLLHRAHHKGGVIDLCRPFWPHLPETTLLESHADLQALSANPADLVFKPAYSRFARRLLIGPERRALSALRPNPADPWLAQERLHGAEICAYALAHQGQVTALAAYQPLYRAGQGAGIYFQPVDGAACLEFTTAFCGATGWNGQISFDLIQTDNGLYPIECNPRAISGLQLFRDPAALVAALEGRGLAVPNPRPLCVPLAMWSYAGWANRHRLADFRADLARAGDAMRWPDGRRIGPGRQLRALGEIALRALRHGESLQGAATADLEWNGPLAHPLAGYSRISI